MSRYPLLDMIRTPADIKDFTMQELISLAAEARQRIIEVISVNGGHLASNLGSVELTLGLHYVFNSPKDKFIWDVSHQTYTHKLLTGRNDRFGGVREYKGLCGFSHPKESPHDHFHAGHAGTALSLAMGVMHNRDLSGRDEYVIPVIGDATLNNGMTFEALNNMSRDMRKFIVVLNDNRMSISKNVGAMTRLLSRFLSNPTSNKIYQELDHLVSKIPSYGKLLAKQGQLITSSIKNLVSPANFFEQFGLSYIGPIDGHNIEEVIQTLQGVKESEWPVIIHMITNKGHGMEEAVKNPVTWHGAKPFDPDTCKFLPTTSTRPTFPSLFGKYILAMAESDPSLVVVTPAMLKGSCLDEMHEKFPDRCLDVGIAEEHAVTFCGGLAYGKKMKVVCSCYATFLQRGFDQLFHDVALQELPVVFAIDRAGISGPDGATHHGIYDISFLNAMPNMVICQPRNGQLLRELMESAFNYGRPVAIRYPNSATDGANQPIEARPVGRGEIIAEGHDLAIIALGSMCTTAMEVRERLMEYGIQPTIIDPIFVKPLDEALLAELLLTHTKIVTLEEHSVESGLGSIINNYLVRNDHKVEVLNIGVPDRFVDQGKNQSLYQEIGLDPDSIADRILSRFKSRLQAYSVV
jgi:1-deoxy-D-xylulose-5-phosphate synthase